MEKINLTRLTASGLCMLGLTNCIMVYTNKIDEGIINWIYLIFFELTGMFLMYKGIDTKQLSESKEERWIMKQKEE